MFHIKFNLYLYLCLYLCLCLCLINCASHKTIIKKTNPRPDISEYRLHFMHVKTYPDSIRFFIELKNDTLIISFFQSKLQDSLVTRRPLFCNYDDSIMVTIPNDGALYPYYFDEAGWSKNDSAVYCSTKVWLKSGNWELSIRSVDASSNVSQFSYPFRFYIKPSKKPKSPCWIWIKNKD